MFDMLKSYDPPASEEVLRRRPVPPFVDYWFVLLKPPGGLNRRVDAIKVLVPPNPDVPKVFMPDPGI